MNNDERFLDQLADEFEKAWQTNQRPSLEDYLNRVEGAQRVSLLRELLPLDAKYRQEAGDTLAFDDYRDLCRVLGIDPTDCLRPVLDLTEDLTELHVPESAERPTEPGVLQIGNYQLLQRLGEGGMGTVWMAEQSEPVKRRVALKVIKKGIGSKEVIARFDAERQALALMNHPNIARILDAGTTSDGQPFFAMELVQGKIFTSYCDDNKLGIEERLELFADVCSGVQHAHQKGIIHRDLKPSNILVTVTDGKPVPKIIDFGLAKAMESTQKLTEQSLFTGVGQILGTLKYMSPEQASFDSLDVDTRTDIYALGVILYELLTGSNPLDDSSIKGQAALKVLEFIREKEPLRPSSKLGSNTEEQVSMITSQRKTDSLRLNRVLLGDLDWIVMKALEKDRTRRYESASGFAADIRRYLNNEPVVARPPSVNYRVRKFVRKNRAGVIAASLVSLTLIVGIIGTSLGLFRALAAERLANQRLAEANEARTREFQQRQEAEFRRLEAEEQRIAAEVQKDKAENYLQQAEAETAAKEVALAKETRQRQYAEAVTDFVEKDFLALTSVDGQSDLFEDASVREMGKDTTLRELLDRAAEKLRQRRNLAPEIEARLSNVIGRSYRENGDAEIGIPFLQRALELRREHLGPNHLDTLNSTNDLALCFRDAGQIDKALPLHEQTLELFQASFGPDHPDTLTSMNNLAICYQDAGQLDKSLPLLEQTLELIKAKLGPEHSTTLASMKNLASGYQSAGQLDKSLPLLEQTLELIKSKLGPDHPHTLATMGSLANGYSSAGQMDKALSLLEQTLELVKAKFGPDHPDTLTSLNNLAMGYQAAGQLDKSLPLLEQTLELTKARLGPDHPDTLLGMNNLALGYYSARELNKSLQLWEQTLELNKAKLGPDHPDTLTSMSNLAEGYRSAGQLDKALPLLEQALELTKVKLGPDHPNTLLGTNNLAMGYFTANQLDKALPLFESAAEQCEKKEFRHQDAVTIIPNTIAVYEKAQRFDEADRWQRKWLSFLKSESGAESPQYAGELAMFCQSLVNRKAWKDAEAVLHECLSIREKTQPDHWSTFNTKSLLGASLMGQQKYVEAEPLLIAGYVGMKQRETTIPPQGAIRIPEALDRLIELYTLLDKPSEAQKYRELRNAYPGSERDN